MQAMPRARHGGYTMSLRSHLRGQGCTPREKTAPGPVLIPHCILFEQDAAHESVAPAGYAEGHVQSEEDHAPLGHSAA